MAENTELLKEQRIRAALPNGFKSTLADEDRLRQLQNANLDNLTSVVQDYEDSELTERDLIRYEVQRVLSSFVTPERTMELPGTGLEFERLQRFASAYKADNDTPSGSIKNNRLATPDDIVFTFANPEVYEEISGNSQATFEVTGHSAESTYEVIDDTGLGGAGQSAGNTLSLDSDEMLYFTGDFIDLQGGQSLITKFQWADIDGEDYGADDAIFEGRLSGAHVFTTQGAWVKSTCDLDAKILNAGDTELVPVAFYMGPQSKAPVLV